MPKKSKEIDDYKIPQDSDVSEKLPSGQEILGAFEYFISRGDVLDSLIKNLMKDFLPEAKTEKLKGKNKDINQEDELAKEINKKSGSEEQNQNKSEDKKREKTKFKLPSLKTIYLFIKLLIKSPTKAWVLFKFVTNQDKYNIQKFKESLLRSTATQKFIERTGAKFENISELMKNLDKEFFKKGQLLDQESAKHIGKALANPSFVKKLKEIAIAAIKENPDPLKMSSKLFGILQNKDIQAFIADKNIVIQKRLSGFIKSKITEQDEEIKEQQERLDKFQLASSEKDINSFLDKNGFEPLIPSKELENFIETLNKHLDKKEETLFEQKIDEFLYENYIQPSMSLEKKKEFFNKIKSRDGYLEFKKDQIKNYLESEIEDLKSQAVKTTLLENGISINKQNIDSVASIAVIALKNPKNVNQVIDNVIAGSTLNHEFTKLLLKKDKNNLDEAQAERLNNLIQENNIKLASNVLTLIDESPELKTFLTNHNSLIGNIVKTHIENNNELLKERPELEHLIGENNNIIPDLLGVLMTKKNLPKLKELAKLGLEGESIEAGIKVADLIDQDENFKSLLKKNKEIIEKIVDNIIEKNPKIKNAVPGLEAGKLANILLSDPKSIKKLLNAKIESKSNLAFGLQAVRIMAPKIFFNEGGLRGVLYNLATGYLFGKKDETNNLNVNNVPAPNNLLSDNEIKESVQEKQKRINTRKQVHEIVSKTRKKQENDKQQNKFIPRRPSKVDKTKHFR